MVKRRGDNTPARPGGRAAERLRMFETARRAASGDKKLKPKKVKPKTSAKTPKAGAANRGRPSDEEQEGRED